MLKIIKLYFVMVQWSSSLRICQGIYRHLSRCMMIQLSCRQSPWRNGWGDRYQTPTWHNGWPGRLIVYGHRKWKWTHNLIWPSEFTWTNFNEKILGNVWSVYSWNDFVLVLRHLYECPSTSKVLWSLANNVFCDPLLTNWGMPITSTILITTS